MVEEQALLVTCPQAERALVLRRQTDDLVDRKFCVVFITNTRVSLVDARLLVRKSMILYDDTGTRFVLSHLAGQRSGFISLGKHLFTV